MHSLPYLYFVWLLKRGQAREASGPPAFEPRHFRLFAFAVSAVALGWLLLRGAPAFLDQALAVRGESALGALGPTPYLAVFVTLVNIHHYFMDHVIWRRDNPEMRHLRE